MNPRLRSTLRKIQERFPWVVDIRDAKRSMQYAVTELDKEMGRRLSNPSHPAGGAGDPWHCPNANALVRACGTKKVLAAYVTKFVSILVFKDNPVAVRFINSDKVQQSVVAYDNGKDFPSGLVYTLYAPHGNSRIGIPHDKRIAGNGNGAVAGATHKMSNRIVLDGGYASRRRRNKALRNPWSKETTVAARAVG